jgi:hypothetical protein
MKQSDLYTTLSALFETSSATTVSFTEVVLLKLPAP